MEYLSLDDILSIQNEALNSLELQNENYFAIGDDYKSILNISPKQGLILIKGNEHLGFDHINLRHAYFGKALWKKNKEELDYPSKFSPKSIPLFEYADVADLMFRPDFLNVKDNSNPNVLDLYVGNVSSNVVEERRFKMLLYKDTKIIHTLFPTNDKYTLKKPKGFVFRKGPVSVSENMVTVVTTIKIPYLDFHSILRYTAVITMVFPKKIQYLKITIHRDGKDDLKFEYDVVPITEEKICGGDLHSLYSFSDLSSIEKEIARIESDKSTWEMMP